MAQNNSKDFTEIEICGHIYYLKGGVLFEYVDFYYKSVSPKDLTSIVLVLNEIVLESEC
jgi:hypothetical protein